MDSHLVYICFSSVILFLWTIREVDGISNVFQLTDFGGVADGKTDNKNAITNGWQKACKTNGGTLVVPSGTFMLSSVVLEGPCNGKTNFQLHGTIKASSNFNGEYWISFHNINGLTISGTGTLDGSGASAWGTNTCKNERNCKIPPEDVLCDKNSLIQGIKSVNSKSFHIHIFHCDNLAIDGATITAPQDSPNTDGIHISKSKRITISNSNIATGDDCVSIGDGSTVINVTNTRCGPGHGFSIGSLGKHENEEDVRDISFHHCTISGTTNGLRIKTISPSVSSVTVSQVRYSNILLQNVKNPIIIDQNYCPDSSCSSKESVSSVLIEDVKFVSINGTSSTEVAVNLNCSKVKPCQGIEFSMLNLILNAGGKPTTASCSNAKATFIGSNQVPSHCS